MPLLFLLVLFVVIGVVAALLSGRLSASMAPPASARPVTGLPGGDLTSADVERLRFSVGLRGYRMDEVDEALDRLRDEVATLRHEVASRNAERGQAPGAVAAPSTSAETVSVRDATAPGWRQADVGSSSRPGPTSGY